MEAPILRIEDVRKRFGSREILRGVSLTVHRGDLKVLIGPSGAGKSTLLQCINFLLRPDTGKVWLEDREIRATDRRELHRYRQKVGMIFQDFNLFDHLTALENVEIGLVRVRGMNRSEARSRAMGELERVGMGDHASKYPAQLSGGQKQRAAIARALAMDPLVMLLDEPTSALDPELVGEVQAVIRNLGENGMTMIMATHQIAFATALAKEILFMEEGVIVEAGPPAKILGNADCPRTREFCSRITDLYGEVRQGPE